jgi:hypothetical protein
MISQRFRLHWQLTSSTIYCVHGGYDGHGDDVDDDSDSLCSPVQYAFPVSCLPVQLLEGRGHSPSFSALSGRLKHLCSLFFYTVKFSLSFKISVLHLQSVMSEATTIFNQNINQTCCGCVFGLVM